MKGSPPPQAPRLRGLAKWLDLISPPRAGGVARKQVSIYNEPDTALRE